MKPLFVVLPLALLLAACATPQQKAVNFQDQLNEQARINFERERNEHRAARGLPPLPSAEERAKAERPSTGVSLNPFASRQAPPAQPAAAVVKPAPAPKPVAVVRTTPFVKTKPAAKPAPAVAKKPQFVKTTPQQLAAAKRPQARPRAIDDTIYEADPAVAAQQRAALQHSAADYQAFEAREARRLGKTPAQLTRQERAMIRAQYQSR